MPHPDPGEAVGRVDMAGPIPPGSMGDLEVPASLIAA